MSLLSKDDHPSVLYCCQAIQMPVQLRDMLFSELRKIDINQIVIVLQSKKINKHSMIATMNDQYRSFKISVHFRS